MWSKEKCKIARPCGAKHMFKSKCRKRPLFWSYDVEKWHATVVRRAFTSQKVRNFPGSAHFWKLGCRKIAHRSGSKHILKQKKSGSMKVSGHFLKCGCRKMARRCGARHITPRFWSTFRVSDVERCRTNEIDRSSQFSHSVSSSVSQLAT